MVLYHSMNRKNGIIIKTPDQISGIRKASHLTAMTLDMIGQYVKPWVSTEELDHICNEFILRNGWKSACIGYHGYPKYTCISSNDTICHGIPSKNEILKEGDIINIDVTSLVGGYFGDASRMYPVGNISKEARDLIQVAKECLDIWLAEVKPGNYFWNIGYYINDYAELKWYSIVREYTWHGTGVEFHEEPYVYHKAPKNSWPKIQPGMIFTIEPIVNIGEYKTKLLSDGWTVKTKDGSLSAQWEHTILVTESGYEILTQ